jgi:hypothetical protein
MSSALTKGSGIEIPPAKGVCERDARRACRTWSGTDERVPLLVPSPLVTLQTSRRERSVMKDESPLLGLGVSMEEQRAYEFLLANPGSTAPDVARETRWSAARRAGLEVPGSQGHGEPLSRANAALSSNATRGGVGLVSLLAAGMNDKSIARELDLSARKLERRIWELVKAAGRADAFPGRLAGGVADRVRPRRTWKAIDAFDAGARRRSHASHHTPHGTSRPGSSPGKALRRRGPP